MDVLWTIIIAVALSGLAWYVFSAEPHWVSKDGQAFTCRLQYLNPSLMPEGRWRDAKAFVDGGYLVVKPRGSVARRPKGNTQFTVLKRAEDPPRGRVTFLLDSDPGAGGELCVLRIPQKSRALPHLEALVKR
jgi:hypothetical protein